MKKHLIFVLVFLIIAPILTVSWLWHNMIESEQHLIQCSYEKALLTEEIPQPLFIEYASSELQAPNYAKHLRIILLSLCFFILGGYFFREYLMHYGKSEEQVSFVNQVSHELKTPLTNIRLYADILKNQTHDDASMVKKLNIITQETERLEQLVNNVLMFGQGENLTLNTKDQNIDQIIKETTKSFEPRFKEKEIHVELKCNAGTACIDRALLEQVLINLLSNAEKYASEGKKIKISARKANDQVSIIIKDYGPGIPHNLKDQILKPFVRGDETTITNASGLGIGLPLCVNLLKAHGGKLELLDSTEGTTFEVTL